MTRRQFCAAPALLHQQGRSRPNIIFLLGDDHRWDALGCMGNPRIHTPNIDALSRAGVTFDNHFVSTAICVTSRASIFSGQWARTHGITDFARQFTPQQHAITYPGVLRAAGYRTGFIGKYGLDKPPAPKDQFDYWGGFLGQGHYFPQGEPGPHLTDIMTGQAREFLGSAKPSQPFCLSISYKAPHVQDEDARQFLPAPEDAARYGDAHFPVPKTMDTDAISKLPLSVQGSEARRRWAVRFSTPALFQRSVANYYALITGIDRSVGTILSELGRLGLRDNTILVYTGDNGFYLGEHGLAGKWFMHEESIRVPLVACGPGLARGRRIDAMTLNVDIAPTLLSLAGAGIPEAMQGTSLAPWLQGQSPRSWRQEWFYEHHFNNGWIPPTEGIRTPRWKYTQYPEERPVFEELYDLQNDRYEENNLAAAPQHAAMLNRLRDRRGAWIEALEKNGRPPA
ncbi:MAG: sulfatase [Acidobacteria bacterium]|nr:sulfatase [Acidobacteriota bacterium]